MALGNCLTVLELRTGRYSGLSITLFRPSIKAYRSFANLSSARSFPERRSLATYRMFHADNVRHAERSKTSRSTPLRVYKATVLVRRLSILTFI